MAVLALAALAACAPLGAPPQPPPALGLVPLSFADLAGWQDDAHGQALAAFNRSCTRLAAAEPDRPFGPAPAFGSRADWRSACAAAALVGAGDAPARLFFETGFTPHLLTDSGEPEGLFTGYYEPELRGAVRSDARYRVPIYGRPADLVAVDLGRFADDLKGRRIAGRLKGDELVPMENRAEIEAGALKGQGLELLWVDDAVDAFFLHVQGSGRIKLADGRVVRLGYAGFNGHPYRSIGRALIEEGAIAREAMSMQAIRAWLAANPERAAALMAENPSYVFFRVNDGEGPVGAQGVALTPERSLAVDTRFVPLGVPLWLAARDPLDAARPLNRLMVAQDTGAAIRGVVRGDVFWGAGEAAAARAGAMQARGRYYVLVPRRRQD